MHTIQFWFLLKTNLCSIAKVASTITFEIDRVLYTWLVDIRKIISAEGCWISQNETCINIFFSEINREKRIRQKKMHTMYKFTKVRSAAHFSVWWKCENEPDSETYVHVDSSLLTPRCFSCSFIIIFVNCSKYNFHLIMIFANYSLSLEFQFVAVQLPAMFYSDTHRSFDFVISAVNSKIVQCSWVLMLFNWNEISSLCRK